MRRQYLREAFLSFVVLSSSSAFLVGAAPVDERDLGFSWRRTKHFLAFGDSYTFVQGTAGHANYSFIGDQLNYSFDAETLLKDKIVQNQTGTSAGGPNWVEFLTDCAVKPGLHSPFSCSKQLWDFAFAGANTATKLLPLHHDYTVSLENQVIQYKTYAYPVLKKLTSPSKTLVAIWIGINDVNDSKKSAVNHIDFYNLLQDALFDSVTELYNLKYRDFVFLNLPPLDRTPANQKTTSPSPNVTQVEWYNTALEQHADAFGKKHPDSNVLVFDAHSVLADILDRPAKYGITNTTSVCAGYNQPDIATNYQSYGCPVPLSQYFWFDSGHITSRVHEILAEKLGRTLKSWRGS